MAKKVFIILATVQILFVQPVHPATVAIINDGIAIKKSVKSWTEFRDENVIKQKYDFSCGTSSLATILRYFFNEDIDEKVILDYLLKERGLEGTKKLKREDIALSFKDLQEYAGKRGYKAAGLAMPLESLRNLKVPAIVYLEIRQYQHFSVYRGMDERYVYLADPSFGNMKIRIDKFKEEFYTRGDSAHPGKVLVLIPQDEEKKKNINKRFMAAGEDSRLVYEVIKDKTVMNEIR
mgnify:CR=1 FL=1